MAVQETSKIAYSHEILPVLGEKQHVIFVELTRHENATNSELAAYLNLPINTVTPRIFELRKMGKVREDCKRTCKITGRTVIAWCVVANTLF